MRLCARDATHSVNTEVKVRQSRCNSVLMALISSTLNIAINGPMIG